jgi:8-oxo-dGTP pyrophosphatase MutT (NUDIX family)
MSCGWLHQLTERLAQPLPGLAAHARFDPQPCPWLRCETPPPDARQAAVLLLLYEREGHWHLPLTLRPSHLAAHAGQVSLPGGAVEPGETSAQAALREFHEELGDDGRPIDLLGSLSPIYVQASNFWVTPWIATADVRPEFTINPQEVEQLLEVPLRHLLDAANFGSHEREYQGRSYVVPHFLFGSHRIWGATCRILGELVTILEGFPQQDF